jgi:hypothetical protein
MDEISLIDGPLTITDDLGDGRFYRLDAKVEAAVQRATMAEIGPALNSLYARLLAAAELDPTLGGLAQVREGADTGTSLEVAINRHQFTAGSGQLQLALQLTYWQSDAAVTSLREPILEALQAALNGAAAGPDPCVRERVLATLVTQLTAALGLPVQRNADRPVAAGGGPQVLFHDGPQIADDSSLGYTLYRTTPAVEVFVPGQNAAQLDALLQVVIGAIRAANRLGGLAFDVTEGDTNPDVLRELYSGPLLAGRIEIDVFFLTPFRNPYVSLS